LSSNKRLLRREYPAFRYLDGAGLFPDVSAFGANGMPVISTGIPAGGIKDDSVCNFALMGIIKIEEVFIYVK